MPFYKLYLFLNGLRKVIINVFKRLELQGFKSFADKTILEFMPGITSVIGPNGSGKVTYQTA